MILKPCGKKMCSVYYRVTSQENVFFFFFSLTLTFVFSMCETGAHDRDRTAELGCGRATSRATAHVSKVIKQKQKRTEEKPLTRGKVDSPTHTNFRFGGPRGRLVSLLNVWVI